MKSLTSILTTLLLLAFSAVSGQAFHQEEDRTGSPYFYVDSDDPENEQLPLKSTSAKVDIAGVIADVTVLQEYKNEGRHPIEAVYVFPASTRAAVYAMEMTIGERVIVARIEEKDRARQQYEEARNNGHSASLLEQERPNVFTMNVANIMPGDLVKVELKYTELLVPEDKVYRFIYPTVVGPRYSSGGDELASREGWNENPYTLQGFKPLYGFSIEIGLNSGVAIKDLRCPSHLVSIDYKSKKRAEIRLDPMDYSGGNRDFILEYRLAGDKIETGALLFKGEKENFFLAMVQPPARISPEMLPPREYVFIVDVSGSMNGFPIETSKKLLHDLIGGLRPSDRFNVILFAGGSSLYSNESVAANSYNISNALRFIDNETGGGGTELLPALRRALQLKGTEGFSRTFVIATDGYVTVEKEAFDLVRKSLGEANFFAFGIGSSVNHYLIEGLAHAGQGEPFVVMGEKDAKTAAEKFRRYISSPVLTNIEVDFEGLDVYDLAQESWPDVFADRPLIIFGKYRGTPRGGILIQGRSGDGMIGQRIDLALASEGDENAALRYLWARERIKELDDYAGTGYETEEAANEVTRLGLDYNLLTRFTSFVAIDTEVRNEFGNIKTVRQPLPLPQGVSNYAVGGGMSKSLRGTGKKGELSMGIACDMVQEEVAIKQIERESSNDIFLAPEVMPEFPGGADSLAKFLAENIHYPRMAQENNIQGRVFVTFLIEKDGSVREVRLLRGIGGGCDEEAIRVIKMMPRWSPGMQRGQAVRVEYVLPVKFSLSGN